MKWPNYILNTIHLSHGHCLPDCVTAYLLTERKSNSTTPYNLYLSLYTDLVAYLGASTSPNPKGLHGLYRDNFTFTFVYRREHVRENRHYNCFPEFVNVYCALSRNFIKQVMSALRFKVIAGTLLFITKTRRRLQGRN
jgi:hypothetical protein